MLELHIIREQAEEAKERLSIKNFKELQLVDDALELDKQRRAIQAQLDELLAEANKISKEIGELFKSGKREEAEGLKARSGEIKEQTKQLNDEMNQAAHQLHELLTRIPNLPHPSVPAGKSEADNELIREWGTKPELGDNAKAHWDLAKEYQLFDLELGVKITGAGFPVYTGKGAKLQRSLITYFLDKAAEAGYNEVIPPLMVNEDSAFGTGQLPDKEGQMYEMKEDPYYLIPTAEVPITNVYRDEIIEEAHLPIKMCGYTPCFRREAGSYGKDVRGLNRVHQFDKVEIVQFAQPEKSYEVLDEMVQHVESLLQSLELPYRIVRLCGGDISFASALTYDFEVWSAAQQRWLEVSSVSNFETFQSNRLKTRMRSGDKKTRLVHTLNGSAMALPRIVAALLENNQTAEGIRLPEVLRSYYGASVIGK